MVDLDDVRAAACLVMGGDEWRWGDVILDLIDESPIDAADREELDERKKYPLAPWERP